MRVPVNVNSNANLLNSQFIVLLITKYNISNIRRYLACFEPSFVKKIKVTVVKLSSLVMLSSHNVVGHATPELLSAN